MKFCPDCSERTAICDFCVWFDLNADPNDGYTGDGFCRRHQRPIDIIDKCEDYECFLAPNADPQARELHQRNRFKRQKEGE